MKTEKVLETREGVEDEFFYQLLFTVNANIFTFVYKLPVRGDRQHEARLLSLKYELWSFVHGEKNSFLLFQFSCLLHQEYSWIRATYHVLMTFYKGLLSTQLATVTTLKARRSSRLLFIN